MTTMNEEYISVLNDLIAIVNDGNKGFATARDDVHDPELKLLFHRFSEQRGDFVSELKEHVRSLGGNPEKSGSGKGALHRIWIDVRAAIANKNREAILKECRKGEEAALKAYQKALNADLPMIIKETIREQRDRIQEVHDEVVHISRVA